MGMGMDRVLLPALPCCRLGCGGRLFGLVRHLGGATAVPEARVKRLCGAGAVCVHSAVTGGWASRVTAGDTHKDNIASGPQGIQRSD